MSCLALFLRFELAGLNCPRARLTELTAGPPLCGARGDGAAAFWGEKRNLACINCLTHVCFFLGVISSGVIIVLYFWNDKC